MEIIKLTSENFPQHARQIAAIHAGAYSTEHLTAHFPADLLKRYYSCLVNESDLSLLCLDDAGREAGFIIAGSTLSAGISKFIRTDRLRFFAVLLKNPIFLWQKIRALLRAKVSKQKPSLASFRLLSISVRSDCQSSGYGKAMLECFEGELMKLGILRYGLSVRSSNKRAISFYERNGFHFEKEFLGSTYFYRNINES
jgi:ribosomal protein S18 acetylase RimI-like enzyme